MSKLEDLKAKIARQQAEILRPGFAAWLLHEGGRIVNQYASNINLLQQEAASLSRLDKMRLAISSPGMRDLNKVFDNLLSDSVNHLKIRFEEYLTSSNSKIEPGLMDLKQQIENASKQSATGADAVNAIQGYMQHLAKLGNEYAQENYRITQKGPDGRGEAVLGHLKILEASGHYTKNSAAKALLKSDLKERVVNTYANSFCVQEESLAKVFTEAYKIVQECAAIPSPDNDKKMQASLDIMKQFERKDLPAGLISRMEKNLGSSFQSGGLKDAFEKVQPLQQELQQRQEQAAKPQAKQDKSDEVQNWKAQAAETHAHHRRHHQHHKEPTPTKHYDSEVMREKYRQFTEGKLDQKAEVQQDAGNSMRKR